VTLVTILASTFKYFVEAGVLAVRRVPKDDLK
jgi:hypothetical protein